MVEVVAAAISGAIAASSGGTLLGLTGPALGALVAGSSLVLSAASQALSKKGKPQAVEFGQFGSERTVTLRQPIAAWPVVYGEARIGGTVTYLQSTNANKFLHMVVTFTGHEVDSFRELWFGDEVVPLDGGGFATGKYAGLVRVKYGLGTPTQAAFPDLVAESGGKWTANHRQCGRANAYIRLQWNADLFSGFDLSKIFVVVRGRKVWDPRIGATRWTQNPALCIADYLNHPVWGLNAAYGTEIDQTALIDAANICEEMVAVVQASDTVSAVDVANNVLTRSTQNIRWRIGDAVQLSSTGALPASLAPATDYYSLPLSATTFTLASSYSNAIGGAGLNITSAGSGTLTVTRVKEPRYTMNGVFSTRENPKDVIEGMLTAMAGRAALRGGVWSLYAGAYIPPTVTLAEGDVRGRIKAATLVSRRESFNRVKGVYVDPMTWQTTDFPPVANATYLAEDNGEQQWKDIELPYTLSPSMAQRLARIELERARQEITVELPCKLTAYRVQPPETVMVTNARRGWTGKPFEVASSRLTMEEADGVPAFAVDLTLRETAAAVYDWNSGQETTVDPAPNSDLPNPFAVAAPTNLALSSGTAELDVRLDGTVFSRIKAAWTAPADEFVLSGGEIEIEFKRSAEATWRPWGAVRGDQTQAFILDVEDGVAYDLRVRSVNALGVKSAWVTALNHTVVGKTAPPSDVISFSAGQNGEVMNFRWSEVPDADLSGYAIRFGLPGVAWGDAATITNVTKGTAITNAQVPPGTFDFLIKAVDTSGNESVTARRASAAFANTFDVIDEAPQAPRWANLGQGSGAGFALHWTGALAPQSQNLADADGFDTFDLYVPNPVASAIYEVPEMDIGFDDTVRVWAGVDAALGPGTAGALAIAHEIDFRTAAGAYGGFRPWSIGEAFARFFKHRIVAGAGGAPRIKDFAPTEDLKEFTQSASGIAVAAGGSTITFAKAFHRKPNVRFMLDENAAKIPGAAVNVTPAGFEGHLYSTAGADVGGIAKYDATGV